MASFGSDDHVPAAMAVNDLVEARDGVARLRILLLQLDEQRAAWAQLEIDAVLAKLSSAISALDTSEVGRSRAAGPDGALYVGSPDTVAGKIAATVSALGLSRFDLKYSNGTLPHDQQMKSIELYGTKVVPKVRELLAAQVHG